MALARRRLLTRLRLRTIVRGLSTAFPCTEDGHPLIDVSPLRPEQEHSKQRAEALRSMAAAFQERGYFYARGVDALPADYIASVYEYSRRAHSLPTHVKKTFAQHGSYFGPDVGKEELAYEPGSVSTVRAWDYSRSRFTGTTSGADLGDRFPGGDVITPPYLSFLDDLYERQNVLGRMLMVAFAEMLHLPRNTLLDMFDGKTGQGDFGTIRLLSYPGNQHLTEEEAAKATTGISPHTDFEVFTLMHQDAPGLQFIPAYKHGIAADRWVDAPVRPGEFVVIVGDILERLTNGDLLATPHRVLRTAHPRSSIIRFNAVAEETIIQPLPQFLSEERPAKYSWVTMGTHMETTIRNLELGLGSWDKEKQRSNSTNYLYIDGTDHRLVSAASGSR